MKTRIKSWNYSSFKNEIMNEIVNKIVNCEKYTFAKLKL